MILWIKARRFATPIPTDFSLYWHWQRINVLSIYQRLNTHEWNMRFYVAEKPVFMQTVLSKFNRIISAWNEELWRDALPEEVFAATLGERTPFCTRSRSGWRYGFSLISVPEVTDSPGSFKITGTEAAVTAPPPFPSPSSWVLSH